MRRVLDLIPGLLALALIPVYIVALSAPAIGHYRDDGIYLVTAKALAEGRGYRILSAPGEPVQTKYPVLFPAVLALVWRLFPSFPSNALALKLVPFLCALLWFFAIWRLISRELKEPRMARWIALFVAASPLTVFLGATVLADIPFALATCAALLYLCRAEAGAGRGNLLAAAALAGVAFHLKTAGIALIVSGAAALAFKRRYRDAALFTALCALLCLPWLAWQFANAGHSPAADPYNSWVPYYRTWNILNFTLTEGLTIVVGNLAAFLAAPQWVIGLEQTGIGRVFCFLMAFFTAVGFVAVARRNWNVVHVFFLLYHLMLLAWAWPPLRFLSAVLPFVFFFAARGIQTVFRRASVPASAVACTVICSILALQLAAQARLTRAQGTPALGTTEQLRWPAFTEAMDGLKKHTNNRDARLLGILDPAFYLYTGTKGVRGFQTNPLQLFYSARHDAPLGSARDLAAEIVAERVTHLVEMPRGLFGEPPYLAALIADFKARYPDAIRTEIQLADGYRLTEVDYRQVAATFRLRRRAEFGRGRPIRGLASKFRARRGNSLPVPELDAHELAPQAARPSVHNSSS